MNINRRANEDCRLHHFEHLTAASLKLKFCEHIFQFVSLFTPLPYIPLPAELFSRVFHTIFFHFPGKFNNQEKLWRSENDEKESSITTKLGHLWERAQSKRIHFRWQHRPSIHIENVFSTVKDSGMHENVFRKSEKSSSTPTEHCPNIITEIDESVSHVNLHRHHQIID